MMTSAIKSKGSEAIPSPVLTEWNNHSSLLQKTLMLHKREFCKFSVPNNEHTKYHKPNNRKSNEFWMIPSVRVQVSSVGQMDEEIRTTPSAMSNPIHQRDPA
ncbi:hypothetical protein KL905_000530 [Ogataea polymorpha]|nr:hypothetical protein KL907_000580 [Ogataea polymorpha]KAG7918994.1 hypothetical protein KL927_001123 [Ogataea polymorpha]KAG7924376.1 hypothetical protein KL905_000530 [Ogataea polymorpha]